VLAAIVSALHLLALAIRLPSLLLRRRALRSRLDDDGLRRLFAADNVSGVAADLWLVTGGVRAFAGVDVTFAFETIEALTGRPPVRWRDFTLAHRGECEPASGGMLFTLAFRAAADPAMACVVGTMPPQDVVNLIEPSQG
jgi:hypothetical protein